MTEGVKLTRAERDLLLHTMDDLVGVCGGFTCPTVEARQLEARGLIKMADYGSHGGGFVCRWVRTFAGRAALNPESAK